MYDEVVDGRRPRTASGLVLEVVDALQHGRYLFNMLVQTQRTTCVPKGMGAVGRGETLIASDFLLPLVAPASAQRHLSPLSLPGACLTPAPLIS